LWTGILIGYRDDNERRPQDLNTTHPTTTRNGPPS
jgi:hypothetical protein